MFDIGAILNQFRAAAAVRGLILPERLADDGKLHRCDVEGGAKSKQDGAYVLHSDGIPAGGFENHRDGLGWESWRGDVGRGLTPEEEAQQRARIEAQRAAREAEAKRRRDKARRQARHMWNAARPATDEHPYLVRKGVAALGLRVGDWLKWSKGPEGKWEDIRIPGALFVPMCDTSGELHSLQAIHADKNDGRDKDFLPGGEKAGHFHLIGQPAEGAPLCVAEGYATAASIHQVTGWPIAVTFDACNLVDVARALRQKYPALPIIVCADDDAFGSCMACGAPVHTAQGVNCPACVNAD